MFLNECPKNVLSLQHLRMKIAKKMMEFLLAFSQDLRGQAQKGTTHMMR